MARYSKMDSATQKKFTDVSNHMRVVMSYLVYEFGYGTRVKQHKYFFYAFYPLHLLLLALIAWGLGLGI